MQTLYLDIMKISASHEWIIMESDTIGIVGISHYAQDLLGDVVYIELPKIGDCVSAKQSIGVIESAKAASDLYSPVSGKIIAVNDELATDPSLVNIAPHSEGWLFKLRLTQPDELAELQSAADYQKSIGG